MNCPACQSPNAANAVFCAHCGARIAPLAPPFQATPSFAAAGATAYTAPIPGLNASGWMHRLVGITLSPKTEWPQIAAEPPSPAQTMLGCVLPLAAIQALLSLVHMAVIGVSVPFGDAVRMPLGSSLAAAAVGFVVAVIAVFVCAFIVNAWAPFFNGRRSLGEALKVAAYAGVPAWLGAFFGVFGMLGTLIGLLAALYAIYVLYLGLPVVMRSARERAFGYTVAVILSGMLVGLVIGALGAAVGGIGFARPGDRALAQSSDAQAAAGVGNMLGGLLGTDSQGKAALGQAVDNLARAGRQMESQSTAAVPAAVDVTARQAGQDATAATSSRPVANDVAATDAANAGAAVGGLLTALGGALGGNQRVAPVDFRTLSSLLPTSLDGLPRGATEGANKEAMGVHGSSASATYGNGRTGTIHLEISDVSGLSGLIGLADSLQRTSDAQSSAGFERDTSIRGFAAHEKYTHASKHGEVQVIVAKRFAVNADGDGVEMAALEQAVGQVDLAKLASMQHAGAQK